MRQNLHGLLLNGTSSSGKTAIATAIRQMSAIPFIKLELDDFLGMIDFRHIDCEPIDGVNETCERLVAGFHRCIAGMIDEGNLVLVDHVLQEASWRTAIKELNRHRPLLMVGVTCPPGALKAREHQRGDRPIGLAEIQLDRVHRDMSYDLMLDTSELAPTECAGLILDRLNIKAPDFDTGGKANGLK